MVVWGEGGEHRKRLILNWPIAAPTVDMDCQGPPRAFAVLLWEAGDWSWDSFYAKQQLELDINFSTRYAQMLFCFLDGCMFSIGEKSWISVIWKPIILVNYVKMETVKAASPEWKGFQSPLKSQSCYQYKWERRLPGTIFHVCCNFHFHFWPPH